MSEQELVKGLTYLGTVYGKEYTKLECEVHYDFLKEFKYETFIQAIKNIIKTSKFLPKINEIIDECTNCQKKIRYEILEFMESKGYFKNGPYCELSAEQQIRNFEKSVKFLETGIIPDWFKEDLKKYYSMMQQEKLEYKEQALIGG